MNIRKHWKKIVLAATAFFWASCHYEDEAQPLYGVYCPPEGCGEPELSSSSEAIPESSSEKAGNSSESNAPSSSSIEQSSSSSRDLIAHKAINLMDGMEIIPDSCDANREGYNPAYMSPYSKAGTDSQSKVWNAANSDSISAESKECLENIMANLQQPVTAYGVTSHIVLDVKCSDGSTFYSKATKKLAESYGITEEEVVKKSEAFDKAYEEGLQKIEQKINNCLDPNQLKSSSSQGDPTSSSSGEVTCTPGDSLVSYYPPSYSADVAKMNAEEKAKSTGVNKIDSIQQTMQTIPQCLAQLRMELDMFVALYGAPVIFPKEDVCSDGTTRPTQEYQKYLKMKEEWEKNKPALDKECQKIYEDKLNAIQQQINKCLSNSDTTKKIACDLEAMCPEYGVDSKCSYNYNCEDGVQCWDNRENTINCTDENGKSVTYTEEEFKSKYYRKRYH